MIEEHAVGLPAAVLGNLAAKRIRRAAIDSRDLEGRRVDDGAVPVRAQISAKLPVIASFSILADFARNVGGDRIEVAALVGPDGDTHVYQPKPADAEKLSAARLILVNGLGLEGWLPRLVQSSGGKATIVTATIGIAPRKLAKADRDHLIATLQTDQVVSFIALTQ